MIMRLTVKWHAFLLLTLTTHSVGIADDAYVVASGNSIRVGNGSVERVFTVSGERAGTSAIVNKLSGSRYRVSSEEFALSIVFGGFGPAVGKEQNGENPSILTASDFKFIGANPEETSDGGRRVKFQYALDLHQSRLRVSVVYSAGPTSPYLRKWIHVADSGAGMHFLHKLDVESMNIYGAQPDRGAFGQPVFAGDIFIGVEYPGVENALSGSHVSSGYIVGETLKPEGISSENGVLGAATSPEELERTFLRYVETIKVRGTRPFLLYNTWYDIRHPSRVNSAAYGMTEANILERIDAFHKYMQVPHDITLDAFVLDDGWDNVQSIWQIDSTTLPTGFTQVNKALQSVGTKLGMWASPFCGYDMRDQRVRWGAAHGYEHTGDFLCFAGDKYGREFKERMVEYTREYGVGYFKWDGLLLACNEPGHGHLPGIYSRNALIRRFSDVMAAVREVNPSIFINITVGTWLSPWWLRYADCVWMQGEDYAYAEDVPSLNPRDKAITYRDAVLWGNFQRQKLLFPVSSMMTHGLIKGRLNLLGGESESLESFTNEAVMYFGRGVMMWELYISPDVLSTDEWHAISSCVKWARSHKDILTDTRMIGGNPLQRMAYGYVHSDGNRALVLLRNPSVRPREISISLKRDLGFRSSSGPWRAVHSYPYHLVSGQTYRDKDSIRVALGGYEVVLLEVTPVGDIAVGTPLDARMMTAGDSILVYGLPGSNRTFSFSGHSETSKLRFPGIRTEITARGGGVRMVSPQEANVSGSASIPEDGATASFGLLFEPVDRVSGTDAPQFRAVVDGISQKASIEQEGGKWFWVTVPVPAGKHDVMLQITGAKPLKGKAETWLFSGTPLVSSTVSNTMHMAQAVELPLPYPVSTEKGIRMIEAFEIGK